MRYNSIKEYEEAVLQWVGRLCGVKEEEPAVPIDLRWFCSFCTMEWKGDRNGTCSYCKKDFSAAISFPNNKPVTDQDRKRYARSINRHF